MTLSELKFIIAVAKEKNFRRAADKCFVSQPALSLAVKKLEEDLNVTIFERSRTEVKVTPIGQKIINQAIIVLDEANKLKDISNVGQEQLKSPLKIGLIYSGHDGSVLRRACRQGLHPPSGLWHRRRGASDPRCRTR